MNKAIPHIFMYVYWKHCSREHTLERIKYTELVSVHRPADVHNSLLKQKLKD